MLQLEREVELLRAQNIALRIAVETGAGALPSAAPTSAPATTGSTGTVAASGSTGHVLGGGRNKLEATAKERAQGAGAGAGASRTLGGESRGYVLGDGRDVAEGPGGAEGSEGYRQQMQSKWENEKKLQKR